MMFGNSDNLNRLLELGRKENLAREDAALRELAKSYHIDLTAPDWIRTLCLALAIEHKQGFFDSAGGILMSIFDGGFGLLGPKKAFVKIPRRRGAPSKKWRERERQQAVLAEAAKVRETRPNLTAPAVARILRSRKWVVPGDKKPLSEKMLTALLRGAQQQQRKHQHALAALLMNPSPGGLFGLGQAVTSGLLNQPSTPKKSD